MHRKPSDSVQEEMHIKALYSPTRIFIYNAMNESLSLLKQVQKFRSFN